MLVIILVISDKRIKWSGFWWYSFMAIVMHVCVPIWIRLWLVPVQGVGADVLSRCSCSSRCLWHHFVSKYTAYFSVSDVCIFNVQHSVESLTISPLVLSLSWSLSKQLDALLKHFSQHFAGVPTRAQLSLGLADRTDSAHSQPASRTVRVWCFEHVVACAQNVNVVTCLFT